MPTPDPDDAPIAISSGPPTVFRPPHLHVASLSAFTEPPATAAPTPIAPPSSAAPTTERPSHLEPAVLIPAPSTTVTRSAGAPAPANLPPTGASPAAVSPTTDPSWWAQMQRTQTEAATKLEAAMAAQEKKIAAQNARA